MDTTMKVLMNQKQILLLHTRLKIIDLDNRANQPLGLKITSYLLMVKFIII